MLKSFQQIALEMGDNTRNLQLFISQSLWKTEPVIAIHQRFVAETFGEAD